MSRCICEDVEITENIMSEEQYNELLKAYTKEALASMLKADIRSRFPEPYASMYCQQFENFKSISPLQRKVLTH